MSRLLGLLLVAACGAKAAKDPAPCDQVGGKVHAVAKAELAALTGLPPATRHGAELYLGPLKDEIDRACRAGAWPVEVRGCMLVATTGAAIKQCATALSPEQRAPLEQVEP